MNKQQKNYKKITGKEMKNVIKMLKMRKVCGEDEIAIEIIKYRDIVHSQHLIRNSFHLCAIHCPPGVVSSISL